MFTGFLLKSNPGKKSPATSQYLAGKRAAFVKKKAPQPVNILQGKEPAFIKQKKARSHKNSGTGLSKNSPAPEQTVTKNQGRVFITS